MKKAPKIRTHEMTTMTAEVARARRRSALSRSANRTALAGTLLRRPSPRTSRGGSFVSIAPDANEMSPDDGVWSPRDPAMHSHFHVVTGGSAKPPHNGHHLLSALGRILCHLHACGRQRVHLRLRSAR